MKKSVRWILSAVIFLLAGLIIFGWISEVLRRKAGGSSDMVHSFYALEDHTLDVLCLGSSHGYSAIQPNIMWKEQGITSYVMCSQRQTVATSYYLLKEALQYQQPKVVALESYYFFYNGKYVDEESEVQLRQAADGMRLGKVKMEMLEDFLEGMDWKEKLTYYIPFIKYHSRWTDLQNYDFNKKLYLKGGILDFTEAVREDTGVPEGRRDIPEVTLEYLDKIIELCSERGIQLIVYEAPYTQAEGDGSGYTKKREITNSLEEYLAEREIPFFYYQKTNEAGIDYSTDFRDHAHLNTRGAAKISRHLASYMAEQYDLPDHRQDEAYSSWQEGYELFMEEVADKGGVLDE